MGPSKSDYVKTLTRGQYYQLVGLMSLARDHYKTTVKIEKAIKSLVGYNDDSLMGDNYAGLFGDAIYEDTSVDTLLKQAGITIEDEEV